MEAFIKNHLPFGTQFGLCCYMKLSIITEWPIWLVGGRFLSIFQTYLPLHVVQNPAGRWPSLSQQAAWALSRSLGSQDKGDLKSVSYRPHYCLQVARRISSKSLAGLGIPKGETAGCVLRSPHHYSSLKEPARTTPSQPRLSGFGALTTLRVPA